MLNALTVSNFRSFREPATLELRPLTIILGRNSSGKSTLARIFPLLRQSIEKQNAAPVLWVSDVVDFGSVGDVVTHGFEDQEIEITFHIDGSSLNERGSRSSAAYNVPRAQIGNIHYSVFLKSIDNRTIFSRLKISIGSQSAEIEFVHGLPTIERLTFNGKVLIEGADTAYIYAEPSTLFPELLRLSESDDADVHVEYTFHPPVKAAFEYFIHGRTRKLTKDYLRRRLVFAPKESMAEVLSAMPNVVRKRIQNKAATDALSDALFIDALPRIIAYVERHLSPILQGVAYLGPVRASGNRFYRIQELSVRSIDSRGENLPMYLSSLDADDLETFNQLLDQACGFRVQVGTSGPGHVTVQIGREGNIFENIADVGFGFTQLLPVVAQLHATIQNASGTFLGPQSAGQQSRIVAIEQPELHLHPALQANLADLFVSALEEGGDGLRIVLETHSEAMIGRLGALVSSKVIAQEDVAVYFVEKDNDGSGSKIRRESFDERGFVTNWPVGFFSADL